jgi:hypothetical protein
MRKGLLFIAALAAFSCTAVPVDVPSEPQEGITVLTAGFDGDETRTVRQKNRKVFWSPADEISVIRVTGGSGSRFVSDNPEPAALALFTGRMPEGSGDFWAVHPYGEDVRVDGNSLMTSVPGVQTAVAGSFDDDAFISAACSSSQDPSKILTFYHVCGGFKFTLSEPGIKRVQLASLFSVDPLSGVVGIQLVNKRPQIRRFGACSNKVELVAPEGETLIPGEAYHIVTIPSNLYDGFTLTFIKENGEMAVRTVYRDAEIRAGHFLSMDRPDRGVTWTKVFSYEPSSAAIPPEGGAFRVKVKSSSGLHISVGSDWIHEEGCEGDLATGATYTFRVDRNPGKAREGMVSLCDDSNCYPFTVSQEDGSFLKEITHHSLGLRFTATWCVHCPKMSESFRLARQDLGDRFEYVSLYSASGGGNYGFADIGDLTSQYHVSGYPTGIIDGRFELKNSYTSEEAARLIASTVDETEMWYPAVTSIALESSLSGRELTVRADVYAQAPDSYKLTVILMENGIIGYQADAEAGPHEDFEHNRVARLTLTPSVDGEEFNVTATGETKSFTYTADIPEEYNPDNLVILAWIRRPFGARPAVQSASYGGWYIDNCRAAPLGIAVPLEVR